MSRRFSCFCPIFLISVFIVGCTSIESIPFSSSQLSHLDSAYPQKPLTTDPWTKANRAIVIFGVDEPHAPELIEKTNWLEVAAVAITGGLVGVTLDLLLDPVELTLSDEFEQNIKKRLTTKEYAKMVLPTLQKTLNQRTPCETLFISYEDESKVKSMRWQPTDRVIKISFVPFFHVTGNKPVMRVMSARIDWKFLMDGTNFSSLEKSLDVMRELHQEAAQKGKFTLEMYKDYEKLEDHYTARGTLFYYSPPYSTQEWLINDGQLIEKEIEKALEQLISQLAQILLLDRPSTSPQVVKCLSQ